MRSDEDEVGEMLCESPAVKSVHRLLENARGADRAPPSTGANARGRGPATQRQFEADVQQFEARRRAAEVQRQEAEVRRQESERRLAEARLREAERRAREAERQLREAEHLRQETQREIERRALERRLQQERERLLEREAALQRQREAEIQQRARENLQVQQEQPRQEEAQEEARPSETRDFKPYMPRIWPRLNAAQVRKKETFLKKLRSQRTMRKRAQDRGESVDTYIAKIDKILREAWLLHRETSATVPGEAPSNR